MASLISCLNQYLQPITNIAILVAKERILIYTRTILKQTSIHKKIYTHGKKLGNTSCVTRVNFGLLFSYNLNMY